jgi:tetratricopeptide (TPR) repeat protein
MYERALKLNPSHAKVLQQLGWLYHHNTQWGNQDIAIRYLTHSVENGLYRLLIAAHCLADHGADCFCFCLCLCLCLCLTDRNDGQSWYLLGRCYMSQQNYKKAYDCYQQAVYKDGRNPTFWCSIGVLYYQTNQVCVRCHVIICSHPRSVVIDALHRCTHVVRLCSRCVHSRSQVESVSERGLVRPWNVVRIMQSDQ